MTYKQRIGVIFGGRSGEHEVSLSSAASVIENLDPQRYDVIPIMITPEGSWLWGKKPPSLEQAPSDQQPVPVVTLPADPTNQHMISMQENVSLPHDGALDVLFPVLHGPNGEDGTIQGLFDLANIPYVGCGVLASAVGMDKIIMKQLFQVAGLPIVDYLGYRRHEWERDPERIIVEIE